MIIEILGFKISFNSLATNASKDVIGITIFFYSLGSTEIGSTEIFSTDSILFFSGVLLN
jgi:hypothetical protein